MPLNPVLQREIRARWRTWPAILILTAFTLLMAGESALVVGLHAYKQSPPPGRILLQYTMPFLIGLWMLLGPALTATAIATERQKGLLSAVLISKLTPRQIILGKWWSAMAFAGLLLLVPMPVMAISLVLGGVSPQEFLLLVLLQCATLSGGAAAGLYVSSVFERPFEALVAGFGMAIASASLPFVSPLLATVQLLSSSSRTFDWGSSTGPCLVSSFTLLLLTHFLHRGTADAITRYFEPGTAPSWSAPKAEPAPQTQPLAATPPLEVVEETIAEEEDVYIDPANGRWDYPLAKRLHFENPLLQREVELKFRLRTKPKAISPEDDPRPMADAGTVVVTFGCVLLTILFGGPGVRSGIWNLFGHILMVILPLAAMLLGALTWTREKERRTLEPLRVLPRPKEDLLVAKNGAILLACAFYAAPVLIPMLICVRPRTLGEDEIGVPQAVLYLSTLVLATIAAAIWGSYISIRSRDSTRSLAGTLGGAVLFLLSWSTVFGLVPSPGLCMTLAAVANCCWLLQWQHLEAKE